MLRRVYSTSVWYAGSVADVTLAVSRRQFGAAVLSTNRQKWIETLRDQLAEVISLIVAALIVKNRFKNHWDEGRGAFESDPALLEKLERLVLAQSKIRVLMNPTEPDHQRLYQAIDVALRRLKSERARIERPRRTSRRSRHWRKRS